MHTRSRSRSTRTLVLVFAARDGACTSAQCWFFLASDKTRRLEQHLRPPARAALPCDLAPAPARRAGTPTRCRCPLLTCGQACTQLACCGQGGRVQPRKPHGSCRRDTGVRATCLRRQQPCSGSDISKGGSSGATQQRTYVWVRCHGAAAVAGELDAKNFRMVPQAGVR